MDAAPWISRKQLTSAAAATAAAACRCRPCALDSALDALLCPTYALQVVSAEELAALAGEYASGARRQVNPRFLAVLRENAAAAATAAPAGDQAPAAASSSSTQAEGAGSSSADAAAASPLAPLYQQLYAAAVVGALRAALEAAEPAAAAQLAAALPPAAPTASVLSAEGASQVEEALAQAAAGPADRSELEHRHSQQVRCRRLPCPAGGGSRPTVNVGACTAIAIPKAMAGCSNTLPALFLLHFNRRTTMHSSTSRWMPPAALWRRSTQQHRPPRRAPLQHQAAPRRCRSSWRGWRGT